MANAALDMNIESPEKVSSHWASLEERGVYFGLKAMLLTYRIMGRFGFSLFLYPVILYFFLVNGTARRASVDFLTHVAAHAEGRKALGRWPVRLRSFRHFLLFGEAILDKLRAWTGGFRFEDIDFENHEAFLALQESGRGGVLIASHLGNAEVSRALGTRIRNLKFTVLVHTKHAENFNKLMREENADSTVSLIQTTEVGPETAILLSQKIAAGEFVVIVGDRTPVGNSSRSIWAPFLGRPAPFPEGPFILAAILKCPVLLIFCLKQNNRFRVIFEPFRDVIDMPRARRRKALEALVANYAQRLEAHCLRDPYQWFNFFDFWNGADRAASDKEQNRL
ncbi:MAG: lipid A biosynthesis acyltransferase [Rhodospirillaceae bacterium]|jgi:predicted LPLAT superfamily acyltransferase|nr:lipid A biosynthesis acyltransferase [Rhodospirillaceae bacterium]